MEVTMTAVGLVGLAITGSRIVGRSLVEGNQRYGTNRTTTAQAAEPTAWGMSWSGTACEVAEVAPVVVSPVRSDAAAGSGASAP
jgi:3-hydroxyisobutyrate dehydrogenase-like beta-hydroxyacid dehydrogenase